MSYKLVLVRHGESEWNKANLFTGWTDVDLSEAGVEEAKRGGQLLKEEGFEFDICYTSYLKRAIHTANNVLFELDQEYIPVIRAWQLNEKHYGVLQGLNKAETAAKYGDDQVKIWRRSFDVAPPELADDDERNPKNQKMFKTVPADELPATESLKTCIARVVPYFENVIVPDLKAGKTVLIAAHGNSLRSLVMYLDELTPEQILEVNIPTAIPLYYELDEETLKPISHRYLISEQISEPLGDTATKHKRATSQEAALFLMIWFIKGRCRRSLRPHAFCPFSGGRRGTRGRPGHRRGGWRS